MNALWILPVMLILLGLFLIEVHREAKQMKYGKKSKQGREIIVSGGLGNG